MAGATLWDNLLAAAEKNFWVMSWAMMPSLEIMGGGGSSNELKWCSPGLGWSRLRSSSSAHFIRQQRFLCCSLLCVWWCSAARIPKRLPGRDGRMDSMAHLLTCPA